MDSTTIVPSPFKTMVKTLTFAGMILLCALTLSSQASPQTSTDTLKSGFEDPPNGARPRVWWHWLNGNITKEGIQLDLEWMHRVGLGGFQNFDASLGTPQVVEHRLPYMTPEWKDTFVYATKLADQLGLEEAIAGSPGWSETGGPWVKPNEGMKKYVWSELEVEGGKPYSGTLPHPPSNTGAFQNMGNHDMISEGDPLKGIEYYADSAVFAYRLPDTEKTMAELNPTVTTSAGAGAGTIDPAALSDGDYMRGVEFPSAEVGGASWILYDFAKPVRIQAITMAMGGAYDPMSIFRGFGDSGRDLEASDDGVTFRQVVHIANGSVGTTTEFAPVTARYFRVTFKIAAPPRNPFADMDIPGMTAPEQKGLPPIRVAELVLHTAARVNRYQEKAAFFPQPDLYAFATTSINAADAVDKSSVVDLTAKMSADGHLDWTPPPGRWEIVRLGYSLLGISNHPASKEATGLEVDKLNHTYVKNYMDRYLDQYENTLGKDWMGKRGLRYVITDSWEAGAQNWTDDMIEQFTKRRGYSPVPWLPVLTGHVVQSAEASDRFLWDLRKTIADLTSDEHYGQVEASIHERGMGHYGESHESGRAFIADGMEVKKLNEVPMSAMWTQTPGVNKDLFGYNADDRESASVGHIYGQNLAAAESMTASAAPWAWSPATLKPTADKEMAEGINRFVIHCSVHQPLIGKVPALGLGPFGQWFTRNETWAEMAGPWVTYLARSSYLLQQGHFAADVIYYYGEDSNLTAIFAKNNPDVPEGYGFDYVNADALIHMLSVRDGRITTPSGMSYRVLGLDPYSEHMSLPVLRALHKLVEEGATVAGPKPTNDPSLADDEAEFHKLADELFGDGSGEHAVGKGKVYAGQTLAEVLPKLNLVPDFDYTKPEADTSLLFVHRRLDDADVYYVDNRSDRSESLNATFRVTGKQAELWHAETGATEAASYTISAGHTTMPLKLEPWGTVFVVFRKPAQAPSHTVPTPSETTLSTVEGSWSVAFQPDRGAPASITLDKLASWSDNSDAGVRYFSGVGTYTKNIDAPAAWFKKGAYLWIDLGDVKNLAEVSVNGKSLGVVWHTPYRVDATATLKPGANTITVKVANAWVNRLIGDQQPNATKYTFTVIHPYKANSPLLPSGLLGPVSVVQTATE
ncbi:glycosyl hydrolase [Acidicapsa acidisoli]|uniref:glycosyl hydrolase n=1 Tax=Acidicapsa acidisoli TaxID=1615681 RepID=UPI0021DF4493|nr:glycosyl hydrolase [Acidicapsa acidisoli]